MPDKTVRFGKFVVLERVPSYDENVECFRAAQPGLDRRIELRLLRSDFSRESPEYDRFVNEFRILSSLDHRSLPKIVDGGELAGRVYYAIIGRDATTFDHILASGNKAFTPVEILEMARDLSSALEHVHEQGYLHRDLGVHSVAWAWEHESAFINNFSFGTRSSSTNGLPAGLPKDSPLAMTPEARTGSFIDRRTDVYLLCAFIYNVSTLSSPFSPHFFESDATGSPRFMPLPASAVSSSVPRQVNKLLEKGLSPRPPDRFQTAAELSAALDKALRRLSIQNEVSRSAELSASSIRLDPELISQIRKKKEKKKKEARRRRILENIPRDDGLGGLFETIREAVGANPVLGALPVLLLFFFAGTAWLFRDASPQPGTSRRRAGRVAAARGSGTSSRPGAVNGRKTGERDTRRSRGKRHGSSRSGSSGYARSSEAVKKTISRIRRTRTNESNFNERFETLKRWFKRVPVKDRKRKLFSYSKLVQIKLKYFNDPEEAARRLDELYALAARYLKVE